MPYNYLCQTVYSLVITIFTLLEDSLLPFQNNQKNSGDKPNKAELHKTDFTYFGTFLKGPTPPSSYSQITKTVMSSLVQISTVCQLI